ncbi:uncharacterized protein LOC101744016 isoform X1 [Bombyx mori]|uniref:Reverse transcriptase domain-containing protein n=1 Tax=Bombyx mori TaxID=7091 RepID=A0A8R2R3U2_BOMMO|nr:uncharacterized protein LOC101744016 isoform X1 [Bombyx mori]
MDVVTPHITSVLKTYQASAPRSLQGPGGRAPRGPDPPPPPPPPAAPPILLAADAELGERGETRLEGEPISCFSVGGERRLCLPQILTSVLTDFTLEQINRVCDELQIYCSRCTPEQLHELKSTGVLPRSAPSCGLITQTDAERLCAALLHAPAASRPHKLPGFRVYHECFGGARGVCSPEAGLVQCSECRALYVPRRFVCHSHETENRTCHWGFDSSHWRRFLLVADEEQDQEKCIALLDDLAARDEAAALAPLPLKHHHQLPLKRKQWQIPSEQAGFVKGRGTREQIVNVRQIIEKSREFNMPILLCFIDYTKAFDCVRWDCLWRILREMGVPQHLVSLIASLYRDGVSMVRVNDVISGPFKPEKGVRQGCILSPILFNVYGEYVMRKALEEWEGGISVGGIKISNLRYADDTTLFASSEKELADLFRRVEYESSLVGLSVNKSKTKVMIVDRTSQLSRTGELSDLEFVSEFIYLGSLLTDRGGSEGEIRRRTQMAKTAMTKLKRIWQNRKVSNVTKMRLVRTLVFSIFLYGAESWTI